MHSKKQHLLIPQNIEIFYRGSFWIILWGLISTSLHQNTVLKQGNANYKHWIIRLDVKANVPFIAKSIKSLLKAHIYLESWILHTETNCQGNSLVFCEKLLHITLILSGRCLHRDHGKRIISSSPHGWYVVCRYQSRGVPKEELFLCFRTRWVLFHRKKIN